MVLAWFGGGGGRVECAGRRSGALPFAAALGLISACGDDASPAASTGGPAGATAVTDPTAAEAPGPDGSPDGSPDSAPDDGTATDDTRTDGPNDDTQDGADTQGEAAWEIAYEVGQRVGRFQSVWGPGADDLYVVGGQVWPEMSINAAAIAHWDGQRWSPVEVPADTPSLNWVFGVQERLVVVGDFGTILWRDGVDGAWNTGSCATVLALWGVWGPSAQEMWAVGGDGINKDPVLCHFDGRTWAAAPLPEPSFAAHALFKIWGTAADHIFAVGDEGWVVHYDGADWIEQPVAGDVPGDLIALWGRSADEILAVGGRSTAKLARWDGTAWSAQSVPRLGGLNGVWMDAAGEAVVVGGNGVAGRVGAGGLQIAVDELPTSLGLHAVFGVGAGADVAGGPLLAVGGSIDMPPPYVGLALRWPG